MLWLLPVGLLSLLLFKTRISCACYLQHSLSICSLLASFFITLLNLVKHLCSLRNHSQHLGRRKPGSTLGILRLRSWLRRLLLLPVAIPPAPCQEHCSRGGALRQIWEINWFETLVCLFWWAYFTGPLYSAAALGQQQGSGGRGGKTGEASPPLSDSSHGTVLPVLCACWKHSHGLQLTGKGKSLYIAWRCKKKAGLAVNRMTPIRQPQGTLNVQILNSETPKCHEEFT